MADRNADAARMYRLEWRLHAQQPLHRRHVTQAREVVEAALRGGRRAFVSVSGGKDSVALLGLVRSVDPDVDAWHFDSGAETPDTLEVLKVLQERYNVRVIRPQLSIHDMVQLVGGLGYNGPKKLEGEWHWAPDDWKRILIQEPAQRLCDEHGYDTIFVGLRGDESRGRQMRMSRFGEMHQGKDGILYVNPLAWWSGLDSLAYAVIHDLPISTLYLRPEHIPPQDRRTASALGMIDTQNGRLAMLRERYPALWHELITLYPEMRDFV